MHTITRWPIRLVAVALFLGLAGCGTNIEEILYQTGTATGRTLFDVMLTDLANAIVECWEGDEAPADGEDDDDANGGENGDDANGGNGEVDGSALYANNCSACHGADGASGFAPDITAMAAETLSTGLESASHGSISLTEEEVAAIAGFLGG